MRKTALLAAAAAVLVAGAAHATVYTNDTNLADFASASSDFARISNAFNVDGGFASDYNTLVNGLRVYNGGTETGLPGGDWILASFSDPESAIRVFPNIDHYGSQYDGYQYSIYGSNDLSNWTFLFDALSVNGSNEPFTLGAFAGTAPTTVNNVGVNPSGGLVGYIADFHFNSAYQFYAFGASTIANIQGNTDQELSGVTAIDVPEPGTWALMLLGFGGLGAAMRARRSARAIA
jgi:hypothetical protein